MHHVKLTVDLTSSIAVKFAPFGRSVARKAQERAAVYLNRLPLEFERMVDYQAS